MAAKLKPFLSIGPGEFIKEELEERGWTQEDLASIIQQSLTTVSKLINNRQAITIEIAKLLGKAFGQSPQYWLKLDHNHRLRMDEETQKEASAEVLAQLFKYMPIREMVKRKWIRSNPKNVGLLTKDVFNFWEIDEIDFSFIDKKLMPYFRRSTASGNFNAYYALTWYKMAENCSDLFNVPNYHKASVRKLAKRIPEFSIKPVGVTEFIDELNKAGVKFLILKHLPKTYVDGASFFAENNPVIVYSQRYDRIDNFWFTIAHELAHLTLHMKNQKTIYVDDVAYEADTLEEKEANKKAAEWLKTGDILSYFEDTRHYISRKRVIQCSEDLALHPAIIVGILQHHEYLERRNLNDFKEKASAYIPEKYYVDDYIQAAE